MARVSDAVELGFVASLSRPGGNLTGISILAPELSGKLIELAKESIPRASRVAVLAYLASPNWKLYFKQMDGTARSLGVQLLAFQLRAPDEIESTFDTARSKRAAVEQPMKFELVINLKTAKLIGLTIPQMCWRERIR